MSTCSMALQMPSSYAIMNEEEMCYLEGGMKLSMQRMYLNKPSCETVANEIIKAGKWKNVTVSQLKKEIYGHAYAYYNFEILKKIPDFKGSTIYEHVANGIDIFDAVDRYQSAWNIIWNL